MDSKAGDSTSESPDCSDREKKCNATLSDVMTKALPSSDITGSFDATTEQAVKDFKQGAGLTVDGIVGPQTRQALPADPNTPTLSRGASGNSVTALQKGLQKYATSATDPGPVNGYFGPRAEAAMKAY